jgi:site-specific DNA recombinase
MPSKEAMADRITDAMVEETLCLPGDKLTLGEIKQKIQKLQDAFSAMLQKAAENPGEDYTEQFQKNTSELAVLKKQRDELEAYLREKGNAYDRVQVTKDLLNGLSPQLTQWDENWIRQLVHTVKVISADRIRVYLNDGTEIDQTVDP